MKANFNLKLYTRLSQEITLECNISRKVNDFKNEWFIQMSKINPRYHSIAISGTLEISLHHVFRRDHLFLQ